MKIVLLHNYYRQPGGEDVVVEGEKGLLKSRGHEVRLLTADNESITGPWESAKVALRAIYSRTSRLRLKREIEYFKPDIVHAHNFFPQFTPSIYFACHEAGVPIVQSLHNFRLICPNGLLFREGKPCELCVGRSLSWPGVMHACYRDSYVGSAVLAAMLAAHSYWGTWLHAVDAYIALSNFSRQKLIAGGLPADRLFVKPNFFPSIHSDVRRPDDFVLFVGRISVEKGIDTLMAAWSNMKNGRRLKIVGDGPLQHLVQRASEQNTGIEFLGRQNSATVLGLMERALCLIFPSECYENCPRVIVEAFAKGLPIVASRVGSAAELIQDGRTGLLFRARDAHDLTKSVEWMFTHPDDLQRMSIAARAEFEANYSEEKNHEQLMKIYSYATDVSRQRIHQKSRIHAYSQGKH